MAGYLSTDPNAGIPVAQGQPGTALAQLAARGISAPSATTPTQTTAPTGMTSTPSAPTPAAVTAASRQPQPAGTARSGALPVARLGEQRLFNGQIATWDNTGWRVN